MKKVKQNAGKWALSQKPDDGSPRTSPLTKLLKNTRAFTLIELLIAISILGIMTMIVSSMFIDSFKNSRRFSLQNSVYEDAGFIMNQLADQINNNYIDYDEYYNQNVVVPGVIPRTNHAPTYGQNFGMYYSAFFNPGNDKTNPADAEGRLGYSCNNGDRNKPPRYVDGGVAKECIPIRDSLDRQTGQNPYTGKPGLNESSANAFCNGGACWAQAMTVNELYLISPDAKQKTIFARERIGGNALADQGIWALSKVQLSGTDESGDGVIDSFKCANGYSCGFAPDCDSAGVAANYPRKNEDLQPTDPQFIQSCDNKENGFAHDFVPISPLRADVVSLSFKITPVEDPAYAFSESVTQREPQVTISLTVRPNPEMLQDKNAFAPFTLVRTVSALSSSSGVKAPVKIE